MGSRHGAAEKQEELYLGKSHRRRPRGDSQKNPAPKTQIDVLNFDITVFLVVTILVLIGVIMVFSASYQMAANRPLFNNDALYFLRQHGIYAFFGFVAMYFISNVYYRTYSLFVSALYIVTVVLLIAVLIYGFAAGGATRWIDLPIIGNFQPSEVAKATVIFTIALLVERLPHALKSWVGTFLFIGIVAALVLLIMAPGGFSTGLIVALIGFGMIFTASPYLLRFFVLGGIGVGFVTAYLGITAYLGTGFRGDRVQAWLDPWADPSGTGYQVIQSLYAVASGGWFGLGIGNSRQASFIPEPQNDMIFAIIIEELGLIGAGLILILFAIFIWRGIVIAIKAPDVFGSMIAIGIVFAIASQTIINVGVVTNTIPNTGVTLPFISYGGTSLLVTMALAGVLLNISRYTKSQTR
ncbi:MAG: putative lipid II flippase FtsW [Defluviitaleaceae bacterium]|nr:putative lipid II flippase FtsW [Defluviitaleaceae bacterium]